MKGQSREDKSNWAMLAAEKIENVGERDEDVWRFVRSVYDFLQEELANLVEVTPPRVVETAPTLVSPIK